MNPTDHHQDADVPSRFERDLSRLIVESFARGETIERTWTVTTPVTDAPDWVVRIEKSYSNEDPPYEPQLLDE